MTLIVGRMKMTNYDSYCGTDRVIELFLDLGLVEMGPKINNCWIYIEDGQAQ